MLVIDGGGSDIGGDDDAHRRATQHHEWSVHEIMLTAVESCHAPRLDPATLNPKA